jgi:hypothetical protein
MRLNTFCIGAQHLNTPKSQLTVSQGTYLSLVTGHINGIPYLFAHPDFLAAFEQGVRAMRAQGLVKVAR